MSQYQPYYPPGYLQQPQQQQNLTPWILLGIGFLVFQFLQQGWPFNSDGGNRHDHQDRQIVDPDEPDLIDDKKKPEPNSDVAKPPLNETYLVRVFESQTDKLPKWLVMQLQDDEFWINWLKEKQVKRYTFDPMAGDTPNPQAETFLRAAEQRGIKAPFWMHCKRGGTVLSVTPFAEGKDSKTWRKTILESTK